MKHKNKFFAVLSVTIVLTAIAFFDTNFFNPKSEEGLNSIISANSLAAMKQINQKYGVRKAEELFPVRKNQLGSISMLFMKADIFETIGTIDKQEEINEENKIVEGDVIVKIKDKDDKELKNIFRLKAGRKIDVEKMIKEYSEIPEVAFAEPNYALELMDERPAEKDDYELISDDQMEIQSEGGERILKSSNGEFRMKIYKSDEFKNDYFFPINIPIRDQEKERGVVKNFTILRKDVDLRTIEGDYKIAVQSEAMEDKNLAVYIFKGTDWEKITDPGKWLDGFFIFKTDKVGRFQLVSTDEFPEEEEAQRPAAKEQVVVAVVDSGMDKNHPIFKGLIWDNQNEKNGESGKDDDSNGVSDDINGWNFTENNADFSDTLGHGTHIGGIVVSQFNSGEIGERGEIKVLPVKVFGGGRFGSVATVSKGIKYAADSGANVINLSLGGTKRSNLLEEAIKYAQKKNSTIISSAGNKGSSERFYPAAFPGVISVCAVSKDGSKTYVSNYGDWVDVCAQGDRVFSSLPNSKWGYLSGTSQSAGFISGLAAKIIILNPSIKDNYKELKEEIVKESLKFPKGVNKDFAGKLGGGYVLGNDVKKVL